MSLYAFTSNSLDTSASRRRTPLSKGLEKYAEISDLVAASTCKVHHAGGWDKTILAMVIEHAIICPFIPDCLILSAPRRDSDRWNLRAVPCLATQGSRY